MEQQQALTALPTSIRGSCNKVSKQKKNQRKKLSCIDLVQARIVYTGSHTFFHFPRREITTATLTAALSSQCTEQGHLSVETPTVVAVTPLHHQKDPHSKPFAVWHGLSIASNHAATPCTVQGFLGPLFFICIFCNGISSFFGMHWFMHLRIFLDTRIWQSLERNLHVLDYFSVSCPNYELPFLLDQKRILSLAVAVAENSASRKH